MCVILYLIFCFALVDLGKKRFFTSTFLKLTRQSKHSIHKELSVFERLPPFHNSVRPSASQPVSLSVSQTVCQSHSVDCQLEEGKGRLRSQADFLKIFQHLLICLPLKMLAF